MKKTNLKWIFCLSLMLLFALNIVYAQQTLSDALKELQVLDIARSYLTIPSLMDFLALFGLFFWISKKAFEKREFPKQVHIILAAILSLSAVILLYEMGTNLIMFLRPLFLLFLLYGIVIIFKGDNKNFALGLGFLALYSILVYFETVIPAFKQGLPFPFGLLKPIFLIIGLVLFAIGIGGFFKGSEDGKGLTDRITDGLTGAKKVKDAWNDLKGKKPDDKKTEEEKFKRFKEELQKLESYLKTILTELYNFGLLDAKEIENAEKQHVILSQAHAFYMKYTTSDAVRRESAQLIQTLKDFKKLLDDSEKNQWWGRRSISRFAGREEVEIKKIEETLNYLKTNHPEFNQVVSNCETLFKQIDNLVAYIQGIGTRVYDENKITRKIDITINDLILKLAKFIPESHKMDLIKIADEILAVDAQLGGLVESLKKTYEMIRDAHSQAQNIDKDLKTIHNYVQDISKNL